MQPYRTLVYAIVLSMGSMPYANCDVSTTMPQTNSVFEIRGVAENDDQNAPADTFPDPSRPTMTVRVLRTVLMNSTSLKDAKLSKASHDGHQCITMTFTPAGTSELTNISTNFLHKRIAFFIDGKICCVPYLASKMTTGEADLYMGSNDTVDDTRRLVEKLKSAIAKPTTQSASTQP